jgi:hypothetical protein
LQYIDHIIRILLRLHGIRRLGLDPNPSPRRHFRCSCMPPGRSRSISAGGSALLGCTADPSIRTAIVVTDKQKAIPLPIVVEALFIGVATAPPWSAATSSSSTPALHRPFPSLPYLRPTSPHPVAVAARPTQSARARPPRGRSPSRCCCIGRARRVGRHRITLSGRTSRAPPSTSPPGRSAGALTSSAFLASSFLRAVGRHRPS